MYFVILSIFHCKTVFITVKVFSALYNRKSFSCAPGSKRLKKWWNERYKMTTHLFSNTFCKLEILFKLQRLKKMKERRERRGENLRSRERNASIHKQGMQFVQSTTQIVQFSSGNKAFFNIFFFFCHSFGART